MLIKDGEILLMQTDTVPGLLCLTTSETGVKKIINIKNRAFGKFAVFIDSLEMAKLIANFNDIQADIFNTVFPGYFTLILEASKYAINNFPSNIFDTNKDGIKTIGIRLPASNICQKLVNENNAPLVATSANISGQQTPDSIKDVAQIIKDKVDYIIDNQMTNAANSTVIDISDVKNIKVLRQGSGDIAVLSKYI